MTTWGFIGSGNIGSTVAQLAVNAGHSVVMSNSRGPETLADVVATLGPRSRAATVDEAASSGEVVVVTIPFKHYREIPTAALSDRIVVDTMNYYPGRDGEFVQLDDGSTTSSELLQALIPDSRVVKAFNNIFYQHLAVLPRPAGSPDRSALPVAGDDVAANASVAGLLDELGYDVVDLGVLAEGWRTQPGMPAYGTPYAVDPSNWPAGARPSGVAEIAELAAAARR